MFGGRLFIAQIMVYGRSTFMQSCETCILEESLASADGRQKCLKQYTLRTIDMKKARVTFVFLLLILMLPLHHAYSQSYYEYKDLRFRHFQIKDGLPSNTIQTIFTDHNGFLWLGTQIGLVRYDGYEFRLLLQQDDSHEFRRVSIHTIFEDRDGFLWVGTYRHGLYRYDPQIGAVIHFDTGTGEDLSQFEVIDIDQDLAGHIWIATENDIRLISGPIDVALPSVIEIFPIDKYKSLIGLSSLEILEDGSIWVGSDQGLIRVLVDSGQTPLAFEPVNLPEYYNLSVKRMQSGSDGTLWLAGDLAQNNSFVGRGIVSYATSSADVHIYKIQLAHFPIYDFGVDNDKFWLATMGDGISLIDKNDIVKTTSVVSEITSVKRYKFISDEDFPIGRNHIYRIFQDENGSIWIGTWLQGLFQISPAVNIFSHHALPKTVANENRSVFMTQKNEDNTYWISSYNNGLFYYDADNYRYESFNSEMGRPSTTSSLVSMNLFRDRSNDLWVLGGDLTLNLYHENEHHFLQYQLGQEQIEKGLVPKWVQSTFLLGITEDSVGNFWIGTTGMGVIQYDPVSKTELANYMVDRDDSMSIGSNRILDVFSDRKYNLWLSCDGQGLYQKLNRSDGSIGFKSCTPKINTIYSIVDDNEGNLWLATLSEGLVKYNIATGETRHFTSHDGIPHECVSDITIDKHGNFWLITPQGLGYFNPESEDCKTFGEEYGLDFDQRLMNKGQMAGDELILSNVNGFYSTDPRKLLTPKSAPPVTITSVRVINEELSPVGDNQISADLPYLDKITLEHNKNDLAISYAGKYLNNPGQLIYSYRLEGQKSDWLFVGKERIARFPNTPPGNYTFRVRASIDGTNWGQPKDLRIRISPPWWKSPLAYLLYIIALVTGIYLLYKIQLDRKLQQAETSRLLELDQFKSRLYTNLTHEFRTPLTVILGMANEILNNPKDWFREGLTLIINNGERVRRLTDDMLDLSKLEAGSMKVHLEQGDIYLFVKFIIGSFESFAHQKEIKIHFWSDTETLEMDFDRDKLTSILTNLLSNAVKFTPSKGDIYVRCTQQSFTGDFGNSALRISIEDTGVGIPKADLSQVFDRFFQAQGSSGMPSSGTGIGLALTKELVELLDGKILVESALGNGTKFSIELPITRDATAEVTVNYKELDKKVKSFIPHFSSSPAFIENEQASSTVLIVEDNEDVIQYLIICLHEQYKLEIAKNGREGWEKASSEIPDIVISDVMMPMMNGFELCQKLKTDIRTSHIPVILLTAKADRSAKLEGLGQGADAYLIKPFDREELTIRIDRMVELRKSLQKNLKPYTQNQDDRSGASLENKFLSQINSLLEKHLDDENFGIMEMCKAMSISRVQLHRKLKALTNQSTSIYIRQYKLERAVQLLKSSSRNIAEVAYEVGFKSPAYFTQVFTETYGFPPSTLRAKTDKQQ